jgi:nickel-dependent lactate racemase
MDVKIPYGSDIIDFNVNSKMIGEIILSSPYSGLSKKTISEHINEGLITSIENFLQEDEPTLLIINDHTRPTPSGLIINRIKDLLNIEKTSVLIASGMHRPTTTSEQQYILGDVYNLFRGKVHHNKAKTNSFIGLGWTSYGTEVLVNNILEHCSRIITIGSVEPHYFAGLTGGRKSFQPGIASAASIINNHSFALSDMANSFALDGNPVHEDMMEFASFVTNKWKVYSIQIVLDRDGSIYSVHYGDLTGSFIESGDDARLIFTREINKKYKVAIAIARPPLDIDLYQSLKAIENIYSVIDEGGIIMLVSPCREGIGEENFYKLLTSEKPRNEILKGIEENYTFGAHKAYRLLKKMEKFQVWLYSDLDPSVVAKARIKTIYDLSKGVNEALSSIGNNAEVLVVNDATIMVPRVKL